ncbi:MAG: protein-L-isoaspartate O-methyltransferase [Alteraurantiacibacter sp. bin_em_oilr2.035]|nr:protein-L-isoaspartate O-methyltransferase [Alteraurantiacibacter sp. bin_em_oilr2.035]
MISDPLDAAEAANATRDRARRAMIDGQLRTSGVNSPTVLKRMAEVAREDFVPTASRGFAYMDRAIRLDNGASLPAPVVHGMFLEEADLNGDEHALVVDSGAGYLAELLRPLVAKITEISVEDALGSGRKGKGADVLMIDGAVEEIPAKLANRLCDGARVITGLATNGVTRLAVGRKGQAGIALMPVQDVGIPQIHAFDKPRGWSF